MPKLSDWSKPGEKPPMVGVWETDFCAARDWPIYQYWNGKQWRHASDFVRVAYDNRFTPSSCNQSTVRFRGLADKPEQSE